jgi:hypothetical protein
MSPDRKLILTKLKENYSLSGQLETFKVNGICTSNTTGNLIEMVLKISEVTASWQDDEVLKLEQNISPRLKR